MNHLAIHEIDHHINTLIHTYLSPNRLNELLQNTSQVPPIPQSTLGTATITTEILAAEIGATATLIWETVWKHAVQRQTKKLITQTASTPLDHQLRQLCIVWTSHRNNAPQDTLFQSGYTTGAVQALWQHPAIYTAINATTAQYLQSQNEVERTRIQQYPTCWVYVFGCLMYQLLQWNHSITSYQLRELFGQPLASPMMLSKPSEAKNPSYSRQLSHAAACLQKTA